MHRTQIRWAYGHLLFSAMLVSLVGHAAAASQPEELESANQPKMPDATRVELSRYEDQIAHLRATARYADAIPLAKQALAIRERFQGADWWETNDAKRVVDTLTHIATLPPESQQKLAEVDAFESWPIPYAPTDEKVERYRTKLAVREQFLGSAHWETARSQYELAVIYVHRGISDDTTEGLAKEALQVFEQAQRRRHPDAAEAIMLAARFPHGRGEYDRAEAYYREAISIFSETLDKSDMAAEAADKLAILLFETGRMVEAEPLMRISLARSRAFPSDGNSFNLGYRLHFMGLLCAAKGDHAGAERYYREALAANQRALGAEHTSVAAELESLARCLQKQGRYEEAEADLRKAHDLRRELQGPDHPSLIDGLDSLSRISRARGDAIAAERYARVALARRRQLSEGDHSSTAETLTILADALMAQGRSKEAQQYYQEALTMYRGVFGDDHYSVAQGLTRLAELKMAEKALEDAERLLIEALAISERQRTRVLGNAIDRATFTETLLLPRIAKLLTGLLVKSGRPHDALLRREQGCGRTILDLLHRPLLARREDQRNRENAGSSGSDTATELVEARDRLQRAEATLREATEHHSDTDTDKHTPLAMRWQEVEKARQAVNEAEAAVRSRENSTWTERRPATPEEIRASLQPGELMLIYTWTDRLVTLLVVPPLGPSEIVGMVLEERGPGVEALELSANKALDEFSMAAPEAGARTAHARELFERVLPADLRSRLLSVERLVVIPDGPLRAIPLEALMIAGRLGDSPPDGAVRSPETIPQVVYADSASVFADRRNAGGPGSEGDAGSRRSALVLGDPFFGGVAEALKPPEHGSMVREVSPSSIASTVGLRRGDVILEYDGAKTCDTEELMRAISSADKVAESKTAGTRASVEIKYARDGQVQRAKIPPGDIGASYYQGSAADAWYALNVGSRSAEQQEAAVSALDQVRLFGGTLRPLPGTRQEILGVARTIEDAGGDVTVLVGDDAAIPNLESSVQGKRYVHLATHGLAGTPARPFDASLALTAPKVPTSDDIGFLTLDRLLRRWHGKLTGCDLVVLSACESDRGVRKGDSVMALPWGFMYAGASSVVASLWKADDQAASLLMNRFYQNLFGRYDDTRGGHPAGTAMEKAEALLEAKLWLRTCPPAEARNLLVRGGLASEPMQVVPPGSAMDYSHPYYWAGFILIGDPD